MSNVTKYRTISSHRYGTAFKKERFEMSKTQRNTKEKVEFGESSGKDKLVVTGGSGFLGQHIVKLLQERADYVKEIHVLDIQPFKKYTDYEEKKPVTSTLGSITDYDAVTTAFQNAASVFHVAGLISFGTSPNIHAMHEINVTGTRNVINACIECGIGRLVFCSSVDVVIGFDDILDGCENTTTNPPNFLFPGYPETKYIAENLVLQANGQRCTNEKELRTVSLRANVMYGEGDQFYVANGLRSARDNGGTLMRVGNGNSLFQQCYVGNSAWAFICADQTLKTKRSIGGEVFFIPDNTPIQNAFSFMKPYLECKGMRLSKHKIPFSIVYWPLVIFEYILKLFSPLIQINFKTASCSVKYINMNLYFKGDKAKTLLGYTPIYSPNEAMKMSLKFYRHMNL